MVKKNTLLLFALFCFGGFNISAQSFTAIGKVFSTDSTAISSAKISIGQEFCYSDINGQFLLNFSTVDQKVKIEVNHPSFEGFLNFIEPKSDSIFLDVQLAYKVNILNEVEVSGKNNYQASSISIRANKVSLSSSASDNVISIVKSLPGVVSNDELSAQYNVRGGNFDENLVYVNGIAIYKSQLMRSSLQEGISFVNPLMVENINFYPGGFDNKFGDKMSSVLDIEYRKPKKNNNYVELSMLSASVASDIVMDKWNLIVGARYKNIALLSSTLDVESNIRPEFSDVQASLNYQLGSKLNINYLANLSLNSYSYLPISRITDFGTINKPLRLIVYYQGLEIDKYLNWTNALSFDYKQGDNFSSKIYFSAYNSIESEYYDILGQYSLSELDGNLGSDNYGLPINTVGIGSQLEHARNDLDIAILSAGISNQHNYGDSKIEYGAKISLESVYDRLNEWEYLDSAGFSSPRTVPEPYSSYTGPLTVYSNSKATNKLDSKRFESFVQFNSKFEIEQLSFQYFIGLRSNFWSVNKEFNISPRASISMSNKDNANLKYWLSVGSYNQSPFYRELRANDGRLNKNVLSQKSWHYLLGFDYYFKSWGRDFKFSAEAYYKSIFDLNPYTVDNLRISYLAQNNGQAFVYGMDFRLNGEFVKGAESWFSLGLMKAEQSIGGADYMPMPNDQRVNFAIFYQDYIPRMPSFKVNLNLVYNTGLPSGSPKSADPYNYQFKLPDYKRLDIGFTKVLVDNRDQTTKSFFRYASISLEVLNIADINNSVSYSWVRDIYSKNMYAVPNRLTGRFWNLKLQMEF